MKSCCPICKSEFESEASGARPFCSPRCKRQDLANWLDGVYRLPRHLEPADLEQLSPEEQAELLGSLDLSTGDLPN
jgi:endogenous inhibitor of DNA gyrase (YacG/DUF329 family)